MLIGGFHSLSWLLLRGRKKHLIEFRPLSTTASYADWEVNDALVRTLSNNFSEACLPVIRHDKTIKAA